MKFSEEFRDRALVGEIASRLRDLTPALSCKERGHVAIMEVCGTHTMSAARFGLRSLLPPGVSLISGPGCPVCVTDQHDIDSYLALAEVPGVVLTTFGDMIRVPGSQTSLEQLRAAGAEVRVVYSPMDAVEFARANRSRQVVFFGVGFETTMPTTAVAIRFASEESIANFSVFCVHKTIPIALRALISAEDVRISGLLLPGHVTTIIGAGAYEFIPKEFGAPCAVAGFEPVDIMLGIESILRQIAEGNARVDNVYARAVTREPNPRAFELFSEVFTPADSMWRGIGVISDSGIEIAERYARFDAKKRFPDALAKVPPVVATPCRCGDVLRGVMRPADCPLFGNACTPSNPVGPCMVSSEGACAAAHKYGGE